MKNIGKLKQQNSKQRNLPNWESAPKMMREQANPDTGSAKKMNNLNVIKANTCCSFVP